MRNVALAAVIGVLVVAGSLVAAPMVKADIDFECTPGCWGAIAASASTGQEVIRLNYRTRQKAQDAAVLWCNVLGKTNDCQLVISGLGCLSVASSGDGKTFAGGSRVHPRRGRRGSLGRCATWVDDRPPRLQRLTSLRAGPIPDALPDRTALVAGEVEPLPDPRRTGDVQRTARYARPEADHCRGTAQPDDWCPGQALPFPGRRWTMGVCHTWYDVRRRSRKSVAELRFR